MLGKLFVGSPSVWINELTEKYGKSISSQNFCRLTGRGTVEFTIEKGDGSTFSPVGGEQRKTATIQVQFTP